MKPGCAAYGASSDLLRLDRVRKDFGDVCAVHDVSFEIPSASTLGLLGPNGAGKTTTMRMILNILTPDAGSIEWNGVRVDRGVRRDFGYMPEERGLYGKMKVREHIAYFGRLHGLVEPETSRRTDRWIEQLGLGDLAKRPCSELSKGNQQKVQIACAAVHEPQLLVLDEPFSGLDPVNADMLLATLNDLKARGTTLVLSSHQMWQLEELCDSFYIITQGRHRISGSLQHLRESFPTRTLRVEPATASVRETLERIGAGTELASSNGTVEFAVPRAAPLSNILRDLMSRDAITHFEAVEPSLHDIYIRAIGTAA